MKPIKFRVWLDEFNKMFYDVGLMGGELYVNIDGKGYDVVGDCRDFKLMQFTGIKDRNGREIYEGDLLQHPNGTIAEIQYSDYLAAFVAVYAQNGDIEMDFLDKEIVNTCEIVGNIYENPELLEGGKNGS
ncbi:MAG: YopX family protein [Bacillales bacterium]